MKTMNLKQQKRIKFNKKNDDILKEKILRLYLLCLVNFVLLIFRADMKRIPQSLVRHIHIL